MESGMREREGTIAPADTVAVPVAVPDFQAPSAADVIRDAVGPVTAGLSGVAVGGAIGFSIGGVLLCVILAVAAGALGILAGRKKVGS